MSGPNRRAASAWVRLSRLPALSALRPFRHIAMFFFPFGRDWKTSSGSGGARTRGTRPYPGGPLPHSRGYGDPVLRTTVQHPGSLAPAGITGPGKTPPREAPMRREGTNTPRWGSLTPVPRPVAGSNRQHGSPGRPGITGPGRHPPQTPQTLFTETPGISLRAAPGLRHPPGPAASGPVPHKRPSYPPPDTGQAAGRGTQRTRGVFLAHTLLLFTAGRRTQDSLPSRPARPSPLRTPPGTGTPDGVPPGPCPLVCQHPGFFSSPHPP